MLIKQMTADAGMYYRKGVTYLFLVGVQTNTTTMDIYSKMKLDSPQAKTVPLWGI